MKAHQTTVGKSDTWLTPPEILKDLGEFDLDPCAAPRPPKSIARYNLALPFECGLKYRWQIGECYEPWNVRVWCNPPFNRYARPKWMEKMADHGNGIMLIPAATETKAFFDYVWSRADAVCFMRGRPHFLHADGTRSKANCGCSIALVAYGAKNAEILERANLGQTLKLNAKAQSRDL